MNDNKVTVTFTLELCEAVWLNNYLWNNYTTLSEKMRVAVAAGMDELKARQRTAALDEQIRALVREREEAYRLANGVD